MVQPGCLEHIKSDTIRVEKWPSAEAAWDTINHAGALSQPGHYQIHLHTPPPHLMHRLEWTGKWTFSHAALPRYLVPRKDTVLLFHFRPGEAKELWGMQMKESITAVAEKQRRVVAVAAGDGVVEYALLTEIRPALLRLQH